MVEYPHPGIRKFPNIRLVCFSTVHFAEIPKYGCWYNPMKVVIKNISNRGIFFLILMIYYVMRDLRQIRQYLTRDAALMAANALVGSRLDYCNSLFRGLCVANLRKLQCIQNSLARIVCRTTCLSHTTPLRKALHWLPISRGGTSTNNSGRLLAYQKSTRHRALAKFSIHHYRNQHPIWRLP